MYSSTHQQDRHGEQDYHQLQYRYSLATLRRHTSPMLVAGLHFMRHKGIEVYIIVRVVVEAGINVNVCIDVVGRISDTFVIAEKRSMLIAHLALAREHVPRRTP